MKKSGHADSRVRCLLVGLVLGVASMIAGGAGCILGPKQDDPGDPTTADTGIYGASDTGTSGGDAAAIADGGTSDSFDPTGNLDGCKGAQADGGDAAHDGDVGCDANVDGGRDGDASDAPDAETIEGGSDVATGG